MDNKIVSIVCCAVILILLIIENMKITKNNKPSNTVQYSLPEEVDEDTPQFDPPQNHPIVIPDYIKNIVKEDSLSRDVKSMLKKYESPPYFNPLTNKGILRDVDEILTQKNLEVY
jgi:hypothetical protein